MDSGVKVAKIADAGHEEGVSRRAPAMTTRRAPDPLDELTEAIAAFTGHAPPHERVERFARYLELLAQWNRTHDLVGARQAARHRPCALHRLAVVPAAAAGAPAARWWTSARAPAFPGVPLHLVDPAIELTLMESRRKRVSFLSRFKRELDLGEIAHPGRSSRGYRVEQDPELEAASMWSWPGQSAPTPTFLAACLEVREPRRAASSSLARRRDPNPLAPPRLRCRLGDRCPYPGGKRRRLFLVVMNEA